MNYEKFCAILNKHIFEGERKELLRKISENPERFIGLFRPTKPIGKVLQHILQSHEIRMGDAFEEIMEEMLRFFGYEILSKSIVNENGEILLLDQYFADGKIYFFIEQKVRDDHDSSKKRGQISNFEAKLKILHRKHGVALIGIMYFVDPNLSKNRDYYQQELSKLQEFYKIKLYLFYGKELFNYLKKPEFWDKMLLWLKQWKDGLPELPEINFDATPKESFEEIKNLELRHWRRILEDDNLWEGGIIKSIFRKGVTLELLIDFFEKQKTNTYKQLAYMLAERFRKHYGKAEDKKY